MITFKKLKYKNILSTGNTFIEISLDTHKKTAIIGKNAGGKSTTLDALVFCLFGKPFRKTNKPILINSKNKSNLLVELEFSISDNNYKIVRGLKPNIFEIYCNNKLIDQDAKSKDYQNYLERYILKTNYNSFINVVILGSARYKSFMEMTQQERRNIIEELLDIQIFSVMNVVLKEKSTKLKEQLTELNYNMELAKEKIALQKQNIEEQKLNKQEQITLKLSDIEKYKTRIEKLKIDIDLIQKHIKVLQFKINDKTDIETKRLKLLTLESKIENNITKLKKEIQFFEKNNECPTCKQSIEQEFKKFQLNKNNSKHTELKDGLGKLSGQIIKFNSRLNEISKIQNHILDHQSEILKLNTSINEIQKHINKELQSINSITDGVENLEENNEKLNIFLEDLRNAETKYNEAADLKKYYDYAALLLKDGGIKTRIIKQYLPTLNKIINMYLGKMDFFVNFNIDENFNEVIKSRHRDEFNFASFSEGEKLRINLAILFAFRQIAKMKNSVNTNLLIMDEIYDSSIDGDGIEVFSNMITQFDDNIFIITHREQMLDKFDRVLKFEKKRDFSRMKEIR